MPLNTHTCQHLSPEMVALEGFRGTSEALLCPSLCTGFTHHCETSSSHRD
uniref:Uncharacterized protein n=1 Tax=Anguilla anguilla TaxID=7936 RepID=A0A0E9WCB7_ANGAN